MFFVLDQRYSKKRIKITGIGTPSSQSRIAGIASSWAKPHDRQRDLRVSGSELCANALSAADSN